MNGNACPDVRLEAFHFNHAYFMTVFACQRRFNLPNYAHTFAAFAHVVRDRGVPCLEDQRSFSISWLSRSREIAFFGRPVSGVNLGLRQTLDWALIRGTQVSAWGPFQITPELFDCAQRRAAYLKSGVPRFVVLDRGTRPRRAFNCIHALSDLGLTSDLLGTGIAYGNRASLKVVKYFKPWIADSARTHPWVADLLQLERYPVRYRQAT
jgi:hypothetical protein